MPPNYQNSLGWLALNLKADRLKTQQAQDFQREQMTREQSQQDIGNAMSVAKLRFQTEADRENRKLQLADMMARVKLQEEGKTARQDDKQAFDADKMAAQVAELISRRAKNEAQVPLIQAQTATIPIDDAEANRHHLATEKNQAEGNVARLLGFKNQLGEPQFQLQNPSAGLDLDNVGPTPDPAPGEAGMTKKQYEEALEKAGTDAQALKDLDEVLKALNDPAMADPRDFGNTGGRFNVKGVSPNTLGDWFGTEGAGRRAALRQKVDIPLNAFMRKYGAALTETELGRALGEAGMQAAAGGKMDLFATDLPILQKSFQYTRDRMSESAQKTAQELQSRKRQTVLAPSDGSRREPPPQVAPGPLSQPSANPNSDDQLRERYKAIRRAQPELTPEQALEAAKQGIPF